MTVVDALQIGVRGEGFDDQKTFDGRKAFFTGDQRQFLSVSVVLWLGTVFRICSRKE